MSEDQRYVNGFAQKNSRSKKNIMKFSEIFRNEGKMSRTFPNLLRFGED